MINLREAKKKDPVKKQPEKGVEGEAMSPMDPPENAYDAPGKVEEVPYEEMPPVLQTFMDEHQKALEEIDSFEEALNTYKQSNWQLDQTLSDKVSRFFTFLDETILDHNGREEKVLFPLLHQRLIESGEHSQDVLGENQHRTAINLMEDDHTKFAQLGALVFNFMGLSPRLPDQRSQVMVADLAFNQGHELIEMLRLHIHREDATLFPLAVKLIKNEEFKEMEKEMDALMKPEKGGK